MACSWCFRSEAQAVTACIAIQERLQQKPVYPGGTGTPVQMQMGIESGEVVEIEGDCYGDAVNSAARLADLAGAAQILTSQRVRDALSPELQRQLRSLGPMYLRGKQEVTEVFRVDWQPQKDLEATVMGVSMFKSATEASLQLTAGGQTICPIRTASASRWAAAPRPTWPSTTAGSPASTPPWSGGAATSS